MILMKRATGSDSDLHIGPMNRELKVRLDELAAKWLNECVTTADVRDKLVMEQIINTLRLLESDNHRTVRKLLTICWQLLVEKEGA